MNRRPVNFSVVSIKIFLQENITNREGREIDGFDLQQTWD